MQRTRREESWEERPASTTTATTTATQTWAEQLASWQEHLAQWLYTARALQRLRRQQLSNQRRAVPGAGAETGAGLGSGSGAPETAAPGAAASTSACVLYTSGGFTRLVGATPVVTFTKIGRCCGGGNRGAILSLVAARKTIKIFAKPWKTQKVQKTSNISTNIDKNIDVGGARQKWTSP